jgi:hypothetical protein
MGPSILHTLISCLACECLYCRCVGVLAVILTQPWLARGSRCCLAPWLPLLHLLTFQ